jgi:RimJ/RimL family protein N-acetyltransferase
MTEAERKDLEVRTMPEVRAAVPGRMRALEPATLSGKSVRLVPLKAGHAPALAEAVRDGELWRLWYTSVVEPQAMAAEVERRLALLARGEMLPFTVVSAGGASDGEVVGMTTLMHVDAVNRRVEIGSTWYARKVQRTSVNTEAKLLLLGYAFEELGCMAVEIRTHFMNQLSRRAIERLGAKLDGVLRNHEFAKDGTVRDTCVYSIVHTEWPAVRTHLRWQLEKPR